MRKRLRGKEEFLEQNGKRYEMSIQMEGEGSFRQKGKVGEGMLTICRVNLEIKRRLICYE